MCTRSCYLLNLDNPSRRAPSFAAPPSPVAAAAPPSPAVAPPPSSAAPAVVPNAARFDSVAAGVALLLLAGVALLPLALPLPLPLPLPLLRAARRVEIIT